MAKLTDEKRFGEALQMVQDESDADDSMQQEVLAAWLKSGQIPSEADSVLLRELARNDSVKAARLLARAELPLQTQQYWLRRASNAGDSDAMLELAQSLRKNDAAIDSIPWLRRSADSGNSAASYLYGECRLLGKDVEENPKEAVEYLKRSAQKGDARAMDLLGVCYVRGWGVSPNPEQAVIWFEKAVEAENPAAFYNLGARYAQGQGVEASPEKAFQLFREGAERGNAICMLSLAKCYGSGFGTTANPENAKKWYVESAKRGNPDAKKWCADQKISIPSKAP